MRDSYAGVTSTCRLDIIARAVSRNLSTRNAFGPSVESVSHAKRGTSVAGDLEHAIIAPVPMVLPVMSRVPMASLTWSPITLPQNWRPVRSNPPSASSRTMTSP